MLDIQKWIEDQRQELIDVNDKIWKFAEIRNQEKKSAELLCKTLEQAGFKVNRSIADIPTAFVAEYGEGDLVIGILGEYDALPGLSQDKVPYRKPLIENGNGHGCNHNLLGVGSLGACLAIKEAIAAGDFQGRIRYYGCPAEEGGIGKAFMVKAGVFNDVDLALTWHPMYFNGVLMVNMLAFESLRFKFHGRTAHAAADPYNGRSALDAVELMNVGANYLREHIIPDARIHYVITRGGEAPNVVPAEAESYYYIRAPNGRQLSEIYDRLCKIAEGASLMTGTTYETKFESVSSNIVLNRTLSDVLLEKMKEVGPSEYNEEELEFAKNLRTTLNISADSLMSFVKIPNFNEMIKDKLFFSNILPLIESDKSVPGSSDVGDVSWVIPTSQFGTVCQTIGTPGHSWQAVAQASMGIGHKGMLMAAKILALSAKELFTNPDLVRKAKEEFQAKIKNEPYVSPIPDGVKLPINK